MGEVTSPVVSVRIRIEGIEEISRALDKLPADAKKAMRDQAKDIAISLTDWIKIAGRTKGGPQGARAASTVKEGNEGFWPVITASNTGRARGRRPSQFGGGVLFGSIFGQNRKSGWYAKRRYFGSSESQFHPWIGGSGYWFRKTAEEKMPWVSAEWNKAADEIIRKWSA